MESRASASTIAPTSSRERFVDAALDLLVGHGFNGTSLQMIGDSLGVSKAAVYYHFRTKDELLAAIVGPAFDEFAGMVDLAEAAPRQSDRRQRGLDAYIDYLIRHRRVASWLSRDVAALTNPVVWERSQALSARIDALLTTAATDPRTQVWRAAITQALTGPVLKQIDMTDEELRTELECIGGYLIRAYHSATRRAKALR
jgi:AcrR family transcriptional regulator